MRAIRGVLQPLLASGMFMTAEVRETRRGVRWGDIPRAAGGSRRRGVSPLEGISGDG